MVHDIYRKVLSYIKKKPFKLWGISLLSVLLCSVASFFFPVPGISLVLCWLIQTATCILFLDAYTDKEFNSDRLFDCFRDWNTVKRVLGGIGWKELWVLIWSLIPIVGPIIAVIREYEYALTPYILMKEPGVGIKEAIKVSKERMNGHKAQMFFADIVWEVAAVLAGLIIFVFSLAKYVGWVFGIIDIFFIAAFWLAQPLISGLIRSAMYVEINKSVEGSEFYALPAAEEKIRCAKCGFENNPDDLYCPKCGTKIGETVAGDAVTEPAAEEKKPVKAEVKAKKAAAPKTGTAAPAKTKKPAAKTTASKAKTGSTAKTAASTKKKESSAKVEKENS